MYTQLVILFLQNFDTSTPEYNFIEHTIKEYPVVMFSKTTCNFCKMAKDLFSDLGVKYHVEEIGQRPDCQAVQDVFNDLTGERTVSI